VDKAVRDPVDGFFAETIYTGERKELERELKKLHPSHLDIALKLGKPKKVYRSKDGDAWYRSGTKTLKANPEDRGGNVFRHEYGHHIDYELSSSAARSFSELDHEFIAAWDSDRKKLGLRMRSTKFKSMDKLHEKLYDKKTVSYEGLHGTRTRVRYEIKDINMTGISDIIDSLTVGLFQSEHGGYGHGKSYYKDKGMRHKENFANLFYLRGTAQWALAVELFPALTARFEEIILEGLKK